MGRENGAGCIREAAPESKDRDNNMLFEGPAVVPVWFGVGPDAEGIDPTKLG
jgi:hypothetical protein